jgi:energy-coupling factor transporter ATP-binding protein EcfA2
MKYKELINFEPITEVVQFAQTEQDEYQKNLVKTFSFSESFSNNLIPRMIRNLDYSKQGETFGIQVVGNYGTGKTHLMSLISLIAEKEELLDLVNDEKPKNDLKAIAGKFKVLRFELGGTESLWDFIAFKIECYFKDLGIEFSFTGHGPITYQEKLRLMMADFEEKFPDKGFLIVIDEMLSHLRGRSTSDKLSQDLQVLQAFGQCSNSSKMKFMFGVQVELFKESSFQTQSEMLSQVSDRYKVVEILKEDVAFIVKNRLLKKNEHQKQKIKEHLDPFLKLYKDMHGRTQEYIDLFPVHPSYFENYEKIRIGKSQRQILKTISGQFSEMLELDVPNDNPGLLTFDMYWEDIIKSKDLLSIPDVKTIRGITDIIYDKIESHFTQGRAKDKGLAKRITNACAIKILQLDLNKKNGSTAESLVDDLCLTDKNAFDRDFLVISIENVGNQLIKATSGQYIDFNTDNSEYFLRTVGGINYDQNIVVYADQMTESQKDDYYFKFLEYNLPLDHNTYRTGFRIWEHTVEWKSHKTYRDGYIFFGNPNEKSTTHPRQHFYMYFMPIFDESKKKRNHEEDEVYFIMDGLSDEFKQAVTLYGAALALEVRADSSQKAIYRQKIDELNKKARALFDSEYVQITKVDYQGKELPINGYPLPGMGYTKEQIFSEVASVVFEDWFEQERPHYPKFSQLNAPVAKDNFNRLVKQALAKIANPEQSNRDGEGMLSGLGLWVPGMLDYSHSPYAKSLLNQLKEKGDGQVLNRQEIIEYVEMSNNLWLSKDFQIEAELQFIVMATLAALGELEITLSSGKSINSTNLSDLKALDKEDFYSFTHVKPPKGLNIAALKAMFIGLLGKDLSNHLKSESTYLELSMKANDWAKRTVSTLNKIQGGLIFKGIEIISENLARDYRIKFSAFSGFCDKLANYTSEARMKNFQFSVEEVIRVLEAIPLVEKVENQLAEINHFNEDISYLQQCKQYITDADFKEEINKEINQLATVLYSNNSKKIEEYKTRLSQLKNRYADWYLKLYLKYRISEADNTQKHALLDSDEKAICDILKEADFLSSGQYHQWLSKLAKLQPADDKVNKALILTAPYQDFNPIDFQNEPIVSIKDYKQQLEKLLENWQQTLNDTLEDPMVKKNRSLLDPTQVKLLEDFESGTVKLQKDNALAIRNAIMSLHKGLEKIELSLDGMKATFNKPLTPDEAVEAFKAYVDNISKGKERDKIRIILK